ncbi:Dynein heavy chain [Plasmodium coatneyi]|uniref:Dynein heavy chain n=1 Tax=Plasmodium coatneyi TaxID=208452 RepID=A0A1B1DWI2_9APIC|nr:Dynein heavy chain [Plasmodium coatneyi]ANQ06945.1 Dynein heavy chain [Plasmodium coatneyi]
MEEQNGGDCALSEEAEEVLLSAVAFFSPEGGGLQEGALNNIRADENAVKLLNEFTQSEEDCLFVFNEKDTIKFYASILDLQKKKKNEKYLIIYKTSQSKKPLFLEMNNDAENVTRKFLEIFFSNFMNKNDEINSSSLLKEMKKKFNNFLLNLRIIYGELQEKLTLPLLPSGEKEEEEDDINHVEEYLIHFIKCYHVILRNFVNYKKNKYENCQDFLTCLKQKNEDINFLYGEIEKEKFKQIVHTILERKKNSSYKNIIENIRREIVDLKLEVFDLYTHLKPVIHFLQKLENSREEIENKNVFVAPIVHALSLSLDRSEYLIKNCKFVFDFLSRVLINSCKKNMNTPEIINSIYNCVDVLKSKLYGTLNFLLNFLYLFRMYREKNAKLRSLSESCGWSIPARDTQKDETEQECAYFPSISLYIYKLRLLIEYLKIYQTYMKLEKIEIPGEKGKKLTEEVHTILREFNSINETFLDINHEIMNEEETIFINKYNQFEDKVKELNKRLICVFVHSFDKDLKKNIKLLNSFLILRDLRSIEVELVRHASLLCEDLKKEFILVDNLFIKNMTIVANNRGVFLEQGGSVGKVIPDGASSGQVIDHSDSAIANGKADLPKEQLSHLHIDQNAPLFCEVVNLFTSLLKRIEQQYFPLRKIVKVLNFKDEKTEEIHALYRSISAKISQYIGNMSKEWFTETIDVVNNFLNEPIFKQKGELFYVNFHPHIFLFISNVKNLYLNNLTVNEECLKIYNSTNRFKEFIHTLNSITKKYNDIVSKTLGVQKDLFHDKLFTVKNTLLRGVTELRWTQEEIFEYIKMVDRDMTEIFGNISSVHSNLISVLSVTKSWTRKTILERRKKHEDIYNYLNGYKNSMALLKGKLLDDFKNIHMSMKQSFDLLKMKKNNPMWKNYVKFVNSIVTDRVTELVNFLFSNLKSIMTNSERDNEPLFTVKINFVDHKLNLDLKLRCKKSFSITSIFYKWVDDFMNLCSGIKRIDTKSGDYVNEILLSLKINRNKNCIEKYFQSTIDKCYAYLESLKKYEHICKKDIKKEFLQFKVQNEVPLFPTYFEFNNNFRDTLKLININVTHLFPNVLAYKNLILSLKSELSSFHHLRSYEVINFVAFHSEHFVEKLISFSQKDISMYSEYLQVFVRDVIYAVSAFYEGVLANLKDAGVSEFFDPGKKGASRGSGVAQLGGDVTSADGLAELSGGPVYEENLVELNDGIASSVVPNAVPGEPPLAKSKKDAFYNLMRNLRSVKLSRKIIPLIFQKTREIMETLKELGITVKHNEVLEEIERNKERVEIQYNEIKEKIIKYKNEEIKNIKVEIKLFKDELKKLKSGILQNMPNAPKDMQGNPYEKINEYRKSYQVYRDKQKYHNELEILFELDITVFDELNELDNKLKELKNLWDVINSIVFFMEEEKKKLWTDIDVNGNIYLIDFVSQYLRKNLSELKNLPVYEHIMKELKKFSSILPLLVDLNNDCIFDRHWNIIMNLSGSTDNGNMVGNGNKVGNGNVVDEGNVVDSANVESAPKKHLQVKYKELTLQGFFDLKLYKHVDAVHDVMEQAKKEKKIENKIREISQIWRKMNFEFLNKNSYIQITNMDTILEIVDVHTSEILFFINQKKYILFIQETILKTQENLKRIDEVINIWRKFLNKFERLQPIYLNSEDIHSQLPQESRMFFNIENEYKEIILNAYEQKNVLQICLNEDLFYVLRKFFKNIELCEKALNDYLDQKKKAFPRFYFLSNIALLDILSNGKNPMKILPYVNDVFNAIKTIEFGGASAGVEKREAIPDTTEADGGDHSHGATPPTMEFTAKGVYSIENEHLQFPTELALKGNVENYLKDLETHLKVTIRSILEKAKICSENLDEQNRDETMITNFISQVVCTCNQIVVTDEINKCFDELENGNESAFVEYKKILIERINKLIKLVERTQDSNIRTKLLSLIILDVHTRDVIISFIKKKISDGTSFDWQAQLKYYWVYDKKANNYTCEIKLCDFKTKYLYEYIGNSGKLVITPLTDKCYITLTQALNLILGGAPAGPAGTGKTETTKDLSKAIGIAIFIFNCSNQMNYFNMSQICIGLSQTGAWGCFDEFNRISIEVLSVVSTQIKCIFDAIKEKKTVFHFIDDEIVLKKTCGFFITMNPGYAGRTELPENLKNLFRSCSMIVPDIKFICENMLMSFGFIKANKLSYKFVELYQLCKELLRKNIHYDWGLRAVKVVLIQAGNLKRKYSNYDEEVILMKALKDFNIPKITHEDIPIFLGLVNDLFPNVDCGDKFFKEEVGAEGGTDPSHGGDALSMDQSAVTSPQEVASPHELGSPHVVTSPPEAEEHHVVSFDEAIRISLREANLQIDDNFILKVKQLKDLMDVRHCVFILGEDGCGKSSVIQILINTLNRMNEKCLHEVINPKSIESYELYGYLNKNNEWVDGALSSIMRKMSRNISPYSESVKHKVLLLDGNIDAEWIESMNTVMDDNKVLTLVSNERIPFTKEMHLFFEITNMKYASPATVSRGGVLYINRGDISYKLYISSWINLLKNHVAKTEFYYLFNIFYAQNIDMLRKQCKFAFELSNLDIVRSICNYIDYFLVKYEKYISEVIRRIENRQGEDDPMEERKESLPVEAGGEAVSLGSAPKGENAQQEDHLMGEDPQNGDEKNVVNKINYNYEILKDYYNSFFMNSYMWVLNNLIVEDKLMNARNALNNNVKSNVKVKMGSDYCCNYAYNIYDNEWKHLSEYLDSDILFLQKMRWNFGQEEGEAEETGEVDQVGEAEEGEDVDETDQVSHAHAKPKHKKKSENNYIESMLPHNYDELYINTIELIRTEKMIKYSLDRNQPILVYGSNGTGKTKCISNNINMNIEKFTHTTISINYYTNSFSLQKIIENNVEKRNTRTYGPPNQKRHIFFLEDMNITAKDNCDTQQTLEFLRQLLTYKLIYDRENLDEKKFIHDVLFIGTVNNNANKLIDKRIQNKFHIINIEDISMKTFDNVYKVILKQHLLKFDDTVKGLLNNIISFSHDLYSRVTENIAFNLSNSAPHYLFNLNDIHGAFHNIIKCTNPDLYNGGNFKFLMIFFHEMQHVYMNKLTSNEHIEIFTQIFNRLVQQHFPFCLEELGRHRATFDGEANTIGMTGMTGVTGVTCVDGDMHTSNGLSTSQGISTSQGVNATTTTAAANLPYDPNKNIFTSFISVRNGLDKMYLGVKKFHVLKEVLAEKLTEYNNSHVELPLVLFDYAVVQICKICRILDFDISHLMLIGFGGSGKQSLVKLSIFINCLNLLQISTNNNYDLSNFKADLQEFHLKCAIKPGNVHVLLLKEQNILDSFLPYINDLTSTGLCNDLFTKDEYLGIFSSIRNQIKYLNIGESNEDVFNYYISKIKRNFKVAVTHSPISSLYRDRLTKFPSFLSNFSFVYFLPWPYEALVNVSSKFLSDLEIEEELKKSICEHMAYVHTSTNEMNKVYLEKKNRYNYVIPKTFLEYIYFYKNLLHVKNHEIEKSVERLNKGLLALTSTRENVEVLKKEIEVKIKNIEEKKVEVNEIIKKVKEATEVTNKEQQIVNEEKKKTEIFTREAIDIQMKADEELSEALPIMNKAKEAVNCITKSAIQELKSLQNPPKECLDVTHAVLIALKEIKNYSWKFAQKIMNNPSQFLSKLQKFDAENMEEETVHLLTPFIEKKFFNYEMMKTKSSACAYLALWLVNIVKYNEVYKKVKPLMDKLQEATNNKNSAEEKLNLLENKVKELTDSVEKLRTKMNEVNEEKNKIIKIFNESKDKLNRAENLVNMLSDEYSRWSDEIGIIISNKKYIYGDCLLLSSFITYLGVFSSSFRVKLWKNLWLEQIKKSNILISEISSPIDIMVQDIQIATWKNEKLPEDRISIENALIVSTCYRWPLLIDPQLQGLKWLKVKGGNNITCLQFNSDHFIAKVKNVILRGGYLIIENVTEEIDNIIDGLLNREFIKRGNDTFVKIDNEEMQFNYPNAISRVSKIKSFYESSATSGRGEHNNSGSFHGDGEVDDGELDNDNDDATEEEEDEEEHLPNKSTPRRGNKQSRTNGRQQHGGSSRRGRDSPTGDMSMTTPRDKQDDEKNYEKMSNSQSMSKALSNGSLRKAAPFFNLILQTKLSNPHFKPEVNSQCTLINFSVTCEGLEEQILAIIVNIEKPELEKQKQILVKNRNEYKIVLNKLEDEILYQLSAADSTTIIDNISLINSLKTTKDTSISIQKQVADSITTENEINKTRELYRTLANEASIVYFILILMHNINYMYQYSLDSFISLLLKSIEAVHAGVGMGRRIGSGMGSGMGSGIGNGMGSGIGRGLGSGVGSVEEDTLGDSRGYFHERAEREGGAEEDDAEEATRKGEEQNDLCDEHMNELIISFRKTIYSWINRGLLEEDKLLFNCIFVFKLLEKNKIHDKDFSMDYLNFFLKPPRTKEAIQNPLKEWLADDCWRNVCMLSKFKEFESLTNNIHIDAQHKFKQWCSEIQPEICTLPLEWKKLSNNSFKKLLIIRSLRPDRVTVTLEKYIRNVLPNSEEIMERKNSFVDTLESSYNFMINSTPILFILTPGSDFIKYVEQLGKKNKFFLNSNLHIVSLGQGQETIALFKLELAHKEGHWIVLENIHLMAKFNLVLENVIDKYAAEGSHPNFRLFLTAEVTKNIPISILERSIKLTNEAPTGFKENLKRAFTFFSLDDYEEKDLRTKNILFSLCYFHSIIVERSKFGAQGFNIKYPFSLSDLRDSAKVLFNYLDNQNSIKVPWNDLKYIFGEIMYGGHIVNDKDMLVCKTYLNYYMKEQSLEGMQLIPFSKNVQLFSPNNYAYDKILKYIDTQIVAESSILYGLNQHAEMSFRTNESIKLLTNIFKLKLQESSTFVEELTTGETLEVRTANILSDILNEIENVHFNVDELVKSIPDDQITPLQYFLFQECTLMNSLTSIMRESLKELHLAIKGEINMNTKMESLMGSLYKDQLPELWKNNSYSSNRNLCSWIVNLKERISFLSDWFNDPLVTPKVFNVSLLFNPNSFFSAIKQILSRNEKCELDKIIMQIEVTNKSLNNIHSYPKEGAYIYGLYLDGANYDIEKNTLCDSSSKQKYFLMPVIHCKPVVSMGKVETDVYECPVYKTVSRGPTYVTNIKLKTKENQEKWVLAGVALILDIADD